MIKAKYVMCSRSVIKGDKSGREVVFKLNASGCPGIPVVNDQLEIIGIITALNVLNAIKDKKNLDSVKATDLMTKDVKTADSEATVDDLVDIIIKNRQPIIPIVNGKKFLGMVSGQEIINTNLDPDLYDVFVNKD